jgi:hypothetical protein
MINEIFQIVGKVFADNEEQLNRKMQPVLLLLGEPKIYNKRITSGLVQPKKEFPSHITLMDNAGRTFTIKHVVSDGGTVELDKSTAGELDEWLNSQKTEDSQLKTVYIKALPDTPMGVIIDIKQILRKHYSLKVIMYGRR